MTEAFLALPEEKQAAILDAAATEFADHGYDKASTNRIVSAAGIGKGMLFYYFGSKLELYHALIGRVSALVREGSERILAYAGEEGILETLQHATRVKMELYLKHPAMFDFITRIFLHPAELAQIKGRFGDIAAFRERVVGELFAKADLSRLRPDIPRERLVRYLGWAMEGYTQHMTAEIRNTLTGRVSDLDLDPYWAEFDTYITDLKILFYTPSAAEQ